MARFQVEHQPPRYRPVCTMHIPSNDERHMRHALQLAKQAGAQEEVPIGAVIVNAAGTILGTGYNSVEAARDATQHAEMIALRNASSNRGNWRLNGTTLYSTLEPCPMCLSALALARVDSVVYAAPDLRLGACGTWIDLVSEKHPFHTFLRVRGGVLQEESADLMRTFFRRRRMEGIRNESPT